MKTARLAILLAACGGCHAFAQLIPDPAKEIEFFEKRVRPILVERCYECHGAKKQKGGLRLDSQASTRKGGESGPALVPGHPEKSKMIEAISYRNPDLQMPPKNKLSNDEIEVLEQWVKLGAVDPRVSPIEASVAAIDIEKGREFWSYQLPQKPPPPKIKDANWPASNIDRFILARLEGKGLHPVQPADSVTLLRRLYYDLAGLPPPPEVIEEIEQDASPQRLAKIADQLLASPRFGERWGRHWLDVARYAESVTLRGLVFGEAWRYRDYVIDAFNSGRPFNRFILEQIAGDLLPHENLPERQRQWIATTFLTLGNSNLEEQDKAQLRMDVVDEQLDTIGKAFLAQTIGCARCHDHKFDPIPTRDYYALAGILRNAQTLVDANVSNWIEAPLPLEPGLEEEFKARETRLAETQEKLKAARENLPKGAGGKSATKKGATVIADLPGIVVDDSRAKRVGEWQHSQYSGRYIGDGYLHDQDNQKGQKTLTFQPELPKTGRYEVRLAYVPGSNRATKVPVTIFSADGETTVVVNQQETPPIDGSFISLGSHRFEQNGQGFVLLSNEGTRGHVIADAVQFLPAEVVNDRFAIESLRESNGAAETVKELEATVKELTAQLAGRPKVMTVKEAPLPADTYVHLRGSVHHRGPVVPRGFLQVASYGTLPSIPADQSGRRQLGQWIASEANPLTARVIVNRIWHWLFGAGLVRTTDNFGTTGESPSHPELLDFLAERFMEEGWSVKKLVRDIVLSRTYQLSTQGDQTALAADPENRLLWRMNRRRMDAECIRDAILAAAQDLKLGGAGPTIKPGTTADYGYADTDSRRSVYVPVFRNALPQLFEAFDFADPSTVTGKRNASTVAPQALFLLNNSFVMRNARLAAEHLLAQTAWDDHARIDRACRLALARPPTQSERALAQRFLRRGGSASGTSEAWTELLQGLFASIDFRYIN